MINKQNIGWCLLVLISSSGLMSTLAHPQAAVYPVYSAQVSGGQPQPAQHPSVGNPLHQGREERKFAEKPNAHKKVALDDLDDIQSNHIPQESGFSWSNMLGMIMQMIFNVGQGVQSPTKSDSIDTDTGVAPSPWANLLTVGLKILTAVLGGTGDGIDKVDNGSSPMQNILAAVLSAVFGTRDQDQVSTMAKQAGEFINIVVNLLDALKTSFSHRSMAARSLGRRDSMSEAAVAGITMFKGYVRSQGSSMIAAAAGAAGDSENCLQMYVCEANRECVHDVGPSSVFCQFGTYATSYVLERTSGGKFDDLYEAGRRGRSGENCRQLYPDCNEV